ncbi:3-dehydroquinate synthase [Corynebacterium caspium]|uniref:3-dehydroquinate synthase n=1 Tax=Corynebacterium caspium TaxID=234828 RepID=UPI0003729152|nr:3-dehydroquinate synthase [Corynebacterium caspium]WKD59204.1 3-dehydroquinate synthase [Corynebacterium caspium DSM 44850]
MEHHPLAAANAGALQPTKIAVNGPQPYEVTIGFGLDSELLSVIQQLGAQQALLLHQPTVTAHAQKIAAALESTGLQISLLELPDAEEAKSIAVLSAVWDRCAELGLNRRDLIVGLGGGAMTDLAGFVAATWMRGIKVVHISTSLLGGVDAAVGGKTGINTAAGKNLVGAFHEPAAVLIDVEHMRSLPLKETISGSAEIIKTGFIADPTILDLYEKDPASCLQVGPVMQELIEKSVAVKAQVVSQDLKESGLREILNYGHTFAHAVEKCENYQWRHGNAVAVGMMFIAYLSEARGLIDAALVARHRQILESVGLPTTYAPGHFEKLYEAMLHDKKNRDGQIRFVALDGAVGKTTRIAGPSKAELEAAYQRLTHPVRT